MLTRKTSFAAIVIAAILMLYACRKFDATSKQTAITPTEFKLADAKEWYYGVFKKNTSFKTTDYNSPFAGTPLVTNNSETNSGTFYKKYPYWNKAIEYNYGSLQIVEMPILLEAKVIVFMGDEDLSASERKLVAEGSLQKVLFFKEQNNKTTVRLVTMIPSLKYLKSKAYDISNNTMKTPDANFEGHVVIRNWQDKIINVFEVKDSKYKRRVELIQSLTMPVTNKTQNSPIGLEEECGWIERVEIERYCIATSGSSGDVPPADPSCDGEWQDREVRTWEYVPCSGEEPDPFEDCMQMGNSNEVCQCEIYGVGCPDVPGDDPPGDNPALINETDNLTDPCLSAVKDKITNIKLTNYIAKLYNSSYVNSQSVNITWNQVSFVPGGGPAQSYPYNNTWVIEISNGFMLSNSSSQEYIGSVMLHEVLHSFINQFNSQLGLQGSNWSDHSIMFFSWTNHLRDALSESFNLDNQTATALALGGMADVLNNIYNGNNQNSGFRNFLNSFALSNYGINLNTAEQFQNQHMIGQLGTDCN